MSLTQIVETDRVLISVLPLPLAQAWRRALYVDSAAAIHERAFFAIEAALKYTASVAVMSWVASDDDNEQARAACGALVKPSLGHWVRMWRTCRAALPEQLIARQWLDQVSRSPVSGQVVGLEGRTVGAILDDSLAAYRNSVSGHGSGLTTNEMESRVPGMMQLGREILSALVNDDAPQLIARAGACTLRLVGPTACLESESACLENSSQLVLRFRDRTISLAPLWVFDCEHDDVLVLNKGAGLIKVEYLSYGNPRSASGLVNYRDHRAESAKTLLESATGQRKLATTDVESLINEAEVSELANRATGVRYGPFRVVRQVHAGGQGVLYEAVEENPPRRVALKTLPLHRALSASARRRLQEEAVALAQVEHPNVVPIYETGETDGIPWIAMKFVDGKSLEEIFSQLRGRAGSVTLADFHSASSTSSGSSDTLPAKSYTERMVSLIREAARALAACHERGIVHRDIKPSNLMVDASGRVILTDFGLARSVDARSQTFTQEFVGTLQYLAPEALLPIGKSGPDGRLDVYGLGATLYEGLALRRPFEEYEQDKGILLHAVQTKDPQSLRRAAPWVSREIETVIMKAIERDRDRRYPSVTEFADDLDRWLRGEPIHARPAGPITISRKWVRRNPAKASMGIAVLFLLLGLTLWRSAEQRRLAQAERQAAKVVQNISYHGGALRSMLGLNRSGNEAYLDAEILREARDTVSLMADEISEVLNDPTLRNTSYASQFERRRAEVKEQLHSLQSLAEFYHQSDLAWFLTGAERDEEARAACEQAAESIAALDDRQWWLSFAKVHTLLASKQIDQLQHDAHRQLILLSAMRAKPAAVNFTEPPDRYLKSARQALHQAEGFQHTAAGALVDWFCRMRVGEKDLPPLPPPVTATDHFLLGITHFWIAQFAQSNVGKMVLSNAPPQSGLDLKNPAQGAIRHLRIACGLDPQQYWHHFSLAWALNETGERALDAAPPQGNRDQSQGERSTIAKSFTAFFSLGQNNVASGDIDPALTYLRDSELALNSCITLRPSFPRGYELRGRSLILQSLRVRKIDASKADHQSSPPAESVVHGDHEAQQLEARGMADFDRATTLAPFDPDVHWARAHTMELLDRRDQAVAAYRQALQLDRPMGRLTGQQWVHMAESYLTHIVSEDEGLPSAEAGGVLALAHWVLSQTDDREASMNNQAAAWKTAQQVLELDATEPAALAVRGSIRLGRGESQAAIVDFDTVLEFDPGNYMAASGRAFGLEQLHEPDAALAIWKHVLQECAVTDWQIRESQDAINRLKDLH